MSYTRRSLAGLVAALALSVPHASTFAVSDADPTGAPQMKQQLVGAGHWQSRRSYGGTQGWQIQVKRLDDDSLSGRITIVGSSLIQQARIEGQIFGSEVDGVIVDDDNVQVATFTGSIAKGGMSGTYTTTDGDSGNWSWDGGGIGGGIGPLSDRAIGALGNGGVDGAAGSDQPSPADQAAAEIQALGLVAPGEQ